MANLFIGWSPEASEMIERKLCVLRLIHTMQWMTGFVISGNGMLLEI